MCFLPITPPVLERVHQELADLQEENNNLTEAIKDRLNRFHSEMMDLRDALNEAINNTAKATEINNINEKTLESNQVRHGPNMETVREEQRRQDADCVSLTEEGGRAADEATGGD